MEKTVDFDAQMAISIITSNLLVLICWFRSRFYSDEEPLEVHDVHITPHWGRSTATATISWHCAERTTWKETILPVYDTAILPGYDAGVLAPPTMDVEIAAQDISHSHGTSDISPNTEESLQPRAQDSLGSEIESNQSQLSTVCIR